MCGVWRIALRFALPVRFVRHGWCDPEQLMLFDSLTAVKSVVTDRISVLGHEKSDDEIMGLSDQINFLWTWCNSDESE
jgi:hypothetical protein